MTTITIRHDHADGTLVEGMERGDGTYEIICARGSGFRWFPTLQTAGIRQSRDQVAKRYVINTMADRLRAAGHTVTVEIDDTPRDRATALADQADRLDERADRLTASATRHAGLAESARTRADKLGERFHMGQPILEGHHSERGARNAQAKMHAATERSHREADTAAYQAGRAAAVGAHVERSARPDVTARRIQKAEAELREIARLLDGYERRHRNGRGEVIYVDTHAPAHGEYRAWLEARKALLEEQLRYDRQLVADAITAGTYVAYSKETVHVGDLVHCGVNWQKVAKVNRTTVEVQAGENWTYKQKFTDIRKLHCTHGEAESSTEGGGSGD